MAMDKKIARGTLEGDGSQPHCCEYAADPVGEEGDELGGPSRVAQQTLQAEEDQADQDGNLGHSEEVADFASLRSAPEINGRE